MTEGLAYEPPDEPPALLGEFTATATAEVTKAADIKADGEAGE